MKQRRPLKFSIILPLTVVCFVAYYLLLRDNFLHISISSIINNSHHLAFKTHCLVLGLLPIYIGTMIFGAAMLGIYLGSAISHLYSKFKRTLEISNVNS